MNEQINQIPERYLPIGTVVILKEAKKRVMIIGFCIIPEDEQNKMYDYLGCMYPEGSFDTKQSLMFNHDQIEKIFHMGLIDDEEKQFKSNLKEILEHQAEKEPQVNIPVEQQEFPNITKLEED